MYFIEHISLEEISSDSQDELSSRNKKKKKKNTSKFYIIDYTSIRFRGTYNA